MPKDQVNGKVADFVVIYSLTPSLEILKKHPPTQFICTLQINVLEDWDEPIPEMLQAAVDQALLMLPDLAPKYEGWACDCFTVVQTFGPHRDGKTNLICFQGYNLVVKRPDRGDGLPPGDNRP